MQHEGRYQPLPSVSPLLCFPGNQVCLHHLPRMRWTSLPVQQQHCLSGAWENPSLEHAGFMVALSTFPSLATSVCASTWLKCRRVSKPDWLFILYILISIHGFRDSRTSKIFFYKCQWCTMYVDPKVFRKTSVHQLEIYISFFLLWPIF